nr:hypothetical protein GCM10020185_07380 [Pseudomonas brassicacearum subsp. brassicacearum]
MGFAGGIPGASMATISGCSPALAACTCKIEPWPPIAAKTSPGDGTLKAPMDGAIVELLVREGSTVRQGQLLMVLEAMKMEHPLKAGVDGVVRQLQVTRGTR